MKNIVRAFLKSIKWVLIALLIVLILANAFILISGRTYIYKAVACTYLVGQSGPGIQDLNYFPYREIKTAEAEPWPTHPYFAKEQLLEEEIKALEKYKTTSFLVFHRDSLLLEHYAETFNSTTISNSFSVAKSIVSILVGIAIDEGKIKNEFQPVSDFIPSYREGKRSALTLYHLLTMSAAMEWSESGGNPLSHNAEAYYGNDLLAMIEAVELESEPGKVFNYQSGATLILGYCVEKATGMSLSDYASEKLWKKIGAEQTAYWSLDHEDGIEKSYCCYYASGRDFARFGKLYMNGGQWNGTRIVSADWVQKSIAPAELTDDQGGQNKRYGYCWWLTEHEGEKVFYMRGILGQYVICIPGQDLLIVRTGHKRGEKRDDQPMDIYEYIDIAQNIVKRTE